MSESRPHAAACAGLLRSGEKTLQIGEAWSRPQQRLDAGGIRQEPHAVALGQGKIRLRLQRAFDVDVQLGLGDAPGQRRSEMEPG